MHTLQTPTHRGRLRALLATGIVLVGTLGTVGAAGLAATPAGAASTVTYEANVTQPGPLSANFAQVPNGDGWAIALSSTQVFNVAHHQPILTIACHVQSSASLCWPSSPTKTVINGAKNYATPSGAGMYIDQATGKLYTYATQLPDNTAGVVCIDTNQPVAATGAQLFCGFTPLSGVGDAPTTFFGGTYSGMSAPVQVGTNWYGFNEVPFVGAAAGTHGTENTLLCFSLTTFAACPSQPYTVPLGGLTVSGFATAPPTGSTGSQVIIPVAGTIASVSTNELACFDEQTGATCTGSWPVSVAGLAGSPFPLLNGTGTPTGVCLPIVGNPCYSLSGALVTTPARMPAAIGANDLYNGPAVVNTAADRVYVANMTTAAVDCFDYSTAKSCTNFPKPISNMFSLYTVNADPYRNNCLWVNSDHGAAQIQNFDETSGATCAPGPIRFFASSAVDPTAPTCTPTSYTSIQVTNPAHSSYTSGQVQFANDQGALLPIAPQPINAFGVASLVGLNFASDPRPQFVITLNGLAASPASVSIRLTWSSPFATACFSEGQTVSSTPGYWLSAANGVIFNYGNASFYGPFTALNPNHPVVGIASLANRSGYWEVASDGGIFAFGFAGYYGSTGGIVLNKPIVGMAATPTGHGYWLVASDGGIFAYGDAKFYGSAGNLILNKPIVGMSATPDGGGYWLVATDGGVFSYGDAQFYGSTGNLTLNKPVVGMAANPLGGGYWMVASDGGIFSYGTSGFHGSSGGIKLKKPIVGMSSTYNGAGYWLVASDGGIFTYGTAGSAGNIALSSPIVGIAS
jgi:hypothetical protein